MNSFIVCLNAVFPIAVMLAIGYGVRMLRLINDSEIKKLNKVIFQTFLPANLFYNIYSSNISSALNTKLILYSFLVVFSMFLISILYTKVFLKNYVAERSVIMQGIFRSNFVLIGLPIAIELCPGVDTSIVSVLIAVVVPANNILSVFALDMFRKEKADPGTVLLNILKNPLIIASVFGIVSLVVGLKLPSCIEKSLSQMGKAASPVLLLLLGASFRFKKIGSRIVPLAHTLVSRLVIMPGLFLTLTYILGFRSVNFVSLIGITASATGVSSFTMAQQGNADAELAGDIVVLSNALCPITIFLWSFIFKSIGAF